MPNKHYVESTITRLRVKTAFGISIFKRIFNQLYNFQFVQPHQTKFFKPTRPILFLFYSSYTTLYIQSPDNIVVYSYSKLTMFYIDVLMFMYNLWQGQGPGRQLSPPPRLPVLVVRPCMCIREAYGVRILQVKYTNGAQKQCGGGVLACKKGVL